MIEHRKDETSQLMADLRVALNDWLHQYAPDQCESERVHDALNRIGANGGTLAYIGELNRRVREWQKRNA